MKKLTFLCIAMVAFAACKKDYTCTCNTHSKSEGFGIIVETDSTFKVDLGKQKKKTAESTCNGLEYNSNIAIDGYTSTLTNTCNL